MAEKNLTPDYSYDKEADVLYVSFGDDEPTYVENIDDLLLLEVGWFSGLPKGFRIMGPKYHNIKSVNMGMIIKQAKKQVRNLMEKRRKAIKQQEPVLADFFGKTLPDILQQKKYASV